MAHSSDAPSPVQAERLRELAVAERRQIRTAKRRQMREMDAAATRAAAAVRQRDNLRDALQRIAESYPSQPYEDGETITEWRPAPTDTGIPTNRRIAREALRAAAVGEGACE